VPEDGFREDIVQRLFIIWARFPTFVPAMQARTLRKPENAQSCPLNTRKGRETEADKRGEVEIVARGRAVRWSAYWRMT
jgi:hypothetical protein